MQKEGIMKPSFSRRFRTVFILSFALNSMQTCFFAFESTAGTRSQRRPSEEKGAKMAKMGQKRTFRAFRRRSTPLIRNSLEQKALSVSQLHDYWPFQLFSVNIGKLQRREAAQKRRKYVENDPKTFFFLSFFWRVL